MKVEKNDFSFEESLKYLDQLGTEMIEAEGLRAYRSMDKDELPMDKVVKVFCVAMSIKIINKFNHTSFHMDYMYAGTVSQILHILNSARQVRQIEMQADGSILVLFDAPMKKDVEDIINLSAQIRSMKDVVLTKFRMPLDELLISVGIEFGPVSFFSSVYSHMEGICYGNAIKRAKLLADAREDCVNISDDIYGNLSEDMQKKLFVNRDTAGELTYYFAPLINIRMRKWVLEQRNG